jgi:type IV secretion system protein VirD4
VRNVQPAEWVFFCAVELALFGLVASAVLALRTGFSIGDVNPWWIASYVRAFGWTAEVGSAARFGAVAAVLAPLLLLLRPTAVDFGRARFARRGEVRAAGLFSPTGILLGKLGCEFLRSGDPYHVLVAAPTRSGKGVGIVIPNLLSWPGSAVVLDIKYENHALTSGYRKAHGQDVFRFSPADPDGRSHRYNPLDSVRSAPAHRISDLQRLAVILLPAPGAGGNSFWQDEARSLFVALGLYVLGTKKIPHTLGEIYRTAMGPDPLHEFCKDVLERRGDLPPACTLALASYLQKSEKERSGVRSTLTAALSLWANPVIDAATSASDFSLADLRKRPTTIYVAVSLDQLPFVMKLLNLFFEQAVTLLAQSLPGPGEPEKVLFLLDEFASLGRMDVLKSSLAFLAGYGVRVCTIVQGLGQLEELYGRSGRESILQNSALQVFFAANDETTARHISERLGTRTIRTETRSFAGGSRFATKSYGHASRALLLPEEVRELGAEEMLLFQEGVPAVRGRKIRYYKNFAFKGRGRPAAEVPQLGIE